MNNASFLNKLSIVTASAALLALSSSVSYAANFSLSSSSGIWTGVNGGSNINGIGTKKVSWGNPTTDKGQSGLRFKGVGSTSFDVDETFKVGTLTHFNNPILNPASGANLQVDLNFSTPDIDPSFNFKFAIDETLNVAPCSYASPQNRPCSDRISFPVSLPSESFKFMGKNLTLELLGFGQEANNFDSEFITKEKKKNKTFLFARITENETPSQNVPEPASILGLLAIGAFGTGSALKGKKNS